MRRTKRKKKLTARVCRFQMLTALAVEEEKNEINEMCCCLVVGNAQNEHAMLDFDEMKIHFCLVDGNLALKVLNRIHRIPFFFDHAVTKIWISHSRECSLLTICFFFSVARNVLIELTVNKQCTLLTL